LIYSLQDAECSHELQAGHSRYASVHVYTHLHACNTLDIQAYTHFQMHAHNFQPTECECQPSHSILSEYCIHGIFSYSLRRNSPIILKPIKSSKKLVSTVFYGSIDAWNYLSLDLHLASSLTTFEHGLKFADLSIFLKG
jgi:hypothetical protein